MALGLHQVIRDNLEEPTSIKIGDIEIKKNSDKIYYGSVDKLGTGINTDNLELIKNISENFAKYLSEAMNKINER